MTGQALRVIISFNGPGTAVPSLGLSEEMSIVDLINALIITALNSGTIYFECNLPIAATRYLNTVVIIMPILTLTLSCTAFVGSGSLASSSGISVIAGENLYLSFVMDGDAAYARSAGIVFSST